VFTINVLQFASSEKWLQLGNENKTGHNNARLKFSDKLISHLQDWMYEERFPKSREGLVFSQQVASDSFT
jgi:hypothetical protein